MSRPVRIILAAASCATLWAPAAAGADVFEGTSLVSETALPGALNQQADYAHDPVVSTNGRYVAFDGSYGGITGVWRRDRQSGAIEPVAVGEVGSPAGSAQLPSISEDGRYVSLTTTAALVVADTNRAPDVYVRDMSVPESPGAFELASAVNGSDEALTYTYPSPSSEEASYGSLAAGRSALSADGRELAFVTSATSNLAGPGTPALQVAFRNLQTRETQLVSAEYDPATGEMLAAKPVTAIEGATSFGAVYSPGGKPPRFGQTGAYHPPNGVGASISGDGSTVAWLGQNVTLQAAVLSQEALKPVYTEPLWRRISDGPGALTRRVSGGSDPANPACAASGETAVSSNSPSQSDPCQGPFATFSNPTAPGTWEGTDAADSIPRLSADGYAVAFLASSPLVSAGAGFGRAENHTDLYIANMREGLTRVQALRRLTELASGQANDLATNAAILDLGISPDGQQVAFTTKRTVFALGSPAYVTAPMTVPGLLELFDVDLRNDTLTRVSEGFEGGPSEHPHQTRPAGEDPYPREGDGALSPSFSRDGNTLAFSSTASNLAYGDGNTPPAGQESLLFDGSDAFAVARRQFGVITTESYVSSAPATPSLAPAWMLGITAYPRGDGSVVLDVQVPGGGTLSASAAATVRISAGSSSRRRRARRGRASRTLATRVIATRAAHPLAAGLTTLTLTLAPRYRALADQRHGSSANASVLFTATGHPALRQSLAVLFRRTVHSARRSRGRGAAHRSHARGHRR